MCAASSELVKTQNLTHFDSAQVYSVFVIWIALGIWTESSCQLPALKMTCFACRRRPPSAWLCCCRGACLETPVPTPRFSRTCVCFCVATLASHPSSPSLLCPDKEVCAPVSFMFPLCNVLVLMEQESKFIGRRLRHMHIWLLMSNQSKLQKRLWVWNKCISWIWKVNFLKIAGSTFLLFILPYMCVHGLLYSFDLVKNAD